MVWGVISFDSRSHLAVISGTVTAQFYDDDILQPVILPFLLRYSRLTFQHDNAWTHLAYVAMNCLQACPTLPWSDRSPDLSHRAQKGRYEKAIATIPEY